MRNRRRLRRALSLVLAAALCLSLFLPAAAGGAEESTTSAEEAIEAEEAGAESEDAEAQAGEDAETAGGGEAEEDAEAESEAEATEDTETEDTEEAAEAESETAEVSAADEEDTEDLTPIYELFDNPLEIVQVEEDGTELFCSLIDCVSTGLYFSDIEDWYFNFVCRYSSEDGTSEYDCFLVAFTDTYTIDEDRYGTCYGVYCAGAGQPVVVGCLLDENDSFRYLGGGTSYTAVDGELVLLEEESDADAEEDDSGEEEGSQLSLMSREDADYSGTTGTCVWYIEDGILYIEPEDGKSGTLGTVEEGDQPWYEYEAEITGVEVLSGVTAGDSLAYYFKGLSNATYITFAEDFDTSCVTSLNSTFSDCTSLEVISGLEYWDTSHVTDMNDTFMLCESMSDFSGIEGWDTSSVTTFDEMFRMVTGRSASNEDSRLTSLDLSAWDTSSATDMEYMFTGCSNLEYLNLSGWNTGKVESTYYMFRGCSSLLFLDLSGWDVSSLTDTRYMFYDCSSLVYIWAGDWTDLAENINYSSSMFRGLSSIISPYRITSNDSFSNDDYEGGTAGTITRANSKEDETATGVLVTYAHDSEEDEHVDTMYYWDSETGSLTEFSSGSGFFMGQYTDKAKIAVAVTINADAGYTPEGWVFKVYESGLRTEEDGLVGYVTIDNYVDNEDGTYTWYGDLETTSGEDYTFPAQYTVASYSMADTDIPESLQADLQDLEGTIVVFNDDTGVVVLDLEGLSFVKVAAASEDYTADNYASYALEGAEFSLYRFVGEDSTDAGTLIDTLSIDESVWSLVDTCTSDEDGSVALTWLVPGVTYRLVETSTLDGYTLPTGQWNVVAEFSKGVTSYTFTSVSDSSGESPPEFISIAVPVSSDSTETRTVWLLPNELEFSFVKVAETGIGYTADNYTSYALEGAVFSLYEFVGADSTAADNLIDTSGTMDDSVWILVDTCTSGKDGLVSFSGLEAGTTYRLIETSAPDGYTLPSGQWNVVLTAGDGGTVTYSITTIKDSDDSSTPDFTSIEAAVETESGSEDMESEEKEAVWLLPNETLAFSFVKVAADSEGYTDEDDSAAYAALAGAEFSLYEFVGEDSTAADNLIDTSSTIDESVWSLVGTCTSDEYGNVEFTGLAEGATYRLIETSAPSGYSLPSGQWNVVLTAGNDGTVTYSIKTIKGSDDSSTPDFTSIEAAVETETGEEESEGSGSEDTEDENSSGTGSTEEEMETVWLLPNEKSEEDLTFSFVKVAEASEEYTESNYTGFALAGAEFSLYEYKGSGTPEDLLDTENYDSGTWTLIGTCTSGKDGLVSFSGLEAGTTYRLIETTAPEGYTLPSGQWNVVLTAGEDGSTEYTITAVDESSAPPAFAELVDEEGDTLCWLLPNSTLRTLPSAGTAWRSISWLGLLPIAAGAVMLGVYLHRRKKVFRSG